MGEIVNLRRERKRKTRDAETKAAEVARAKHGRTAAERRVEDAAEARRRALLDGARLATDKEPEPD